MAEQKLSYSQIADPNLFEPLKQEITDVINLLGMTEKGLKEVIAEAAKLGKTTPLDSFANIETREKGINDAADALKKLDKVEKDRLKLQDRLKDLEDGRTQANFNLREQIRLQTKELRETARAGNTAKDAYKQLSKETNEAQAEFKRLSVELQNAEREFGANSDTVQALKQEVQEAGDLFNDLDSRLRAVNTDAKDGRRDVGRYEKGFEGLRLEVQSAEKEFKDLSVQFGINSREAKKAAKLYAELKEELEEVSDSVKGAASDTKTLTKAFKAFATASIVLKLFELLNNAISRNSEGTAELEKIWVRVTGTFQVVAGRLVILFGDLQNGFTAVQARLERFVISFEIKLLTLQKSLVGASDDIKELLGIDASGTDDITEKISKLTQEFENLEKQTEFSFSGAFDGIADEIAKVVSAQIELIDLTLEYRKEIIKNEQQINNNIEAQEKLRATFEDDSKALNEQVLAGVAFRKSLRDTQILQEDIARRRVELSRLNARSSKNNVDAQEELIQAEREYVQLVSDNFSEIAAIEREVQKLRDDTTQQNLDFYVDDFDNRKTVNERIIADETQTFERRRELLKLNEQLSEDSFDAITEALNTSLTQRGKAELDFDELRKQTSSTEIARIVQEAGLSEQLNTRVLEILRERRTVLRDNAEAQRDLTAAEQESARLTDDIVLQEQALADIQKQGVDLEKVLQSLADARLQDDIDNLKIRLDAAEDGSADFIAINQELNDKLLDQNQTRIDREKEANEKALKDLEKSSEAAFDLLGDLLDKRSEKRVASINEELSAEQARAQALQQLAAEGNEDAQDNIALTEQRQRQLELERQQQIKRQQQAELALTAVQTYAAKASAGDPNPLVSTIADIEVLRAFVGSLDSFFTGTEDTGVATSPLDANGGRLAVLHNNERVITAQQNKIIGDMSNAELTSLAHRENINKSHQPNRDVVKALQQLTDVTKNVPRYMGTSYDDMTDMIIKKVKKGSTLEKTHRRSGGIWGV